MNPKFNHPLDALRHHVSGAVARGEKQAIAGRPVAPHRRPWSVAAESWDRCMQLFPTWLTERSGIAVFQCEDMSSSHIGDTSFIPVRFIGSDEQWHEAGDQIGDLPSQRQQRVDTITLDEFGTVEAALKAFVVQEPAPVKPARRKKS